MTLKGIVHLPTGQAFRVSCVAGPERPSQKTKSSEMGLNVLSGYRLAGLCSPLPSPAAFGQGNNLQWVPACPSILCFLCGRSRENQKQGKSPECHFRGLKIILGVSFGVRAGAWLCWVFFSFQRVQVFFVSCVAGREGQKQDMDTVYLALSRLQYKSCAQQKTSNQGTQWFSSNSESLAAPGAFQQGPEEHSEGHHQAGALQALQGCSGD